MTKEGRKFFGWFYTLGLALIFGLQVGCVDVGSTSGGATASNDADTTSTSDQTQTQTQE